VPEALRVDTASGGTDTQALPLVKAGIASLALLGDARLASADFFARHLLFVPINIDK